MRLQLDFIDVYKRQIYRWDWNCNFSEWGCCLLFYWEYWLSNIEKSTITERLSSVSYTHLRQSASKLPPSSGRRGPHCPTVSAIPPFTWTCPTRTPHALSCPSHWMPLPLRYWFSSMPRSISSRGWQIFRVSIRSVSYTHLRFLWMAASLAYRKWDSGQLAADIPWPLFLFAGRGLYGYRCSGGD